MLKRVVLTFIIFCFGITPLYASSSSKKELSPTQKLYHYVNKITLRGGFGIVETKTRSFNNTQDHFLSIGLHSQAGYRWKKWELNIASYIHFGRPKRLEYHTHNIVVRGNGKNRSVAFSPLLKYITDYQPRKTWHLYFAAGPSLSQETIKLEDYHVLSGTFERNNRFSFRSMGAMAVIGVEEILPYKEMHPVYIEFLYNYRESEYISVLNAKSFDDVEALTTENTSRKIYNHIFMLNMGMIIF